MKPPDEVIRKKGVNYLESKSIWIIGDFSLYFIFRSLYMNPVTHSVAIDNKLRKELNLLYIKIIEIM